jgi:hypothetical protein
MRDAEIDQPRLFDAADDLDGMTECASSLLQKVLSVARPAQGVRANRAHVVARHLAQTLSEPVQTRQSTLPGVGCQIVARVQPGAKAHHLSQTINDMDTAVDDAHDD